jgi:hypothetical protein
MDPKLASLLDEQYRLQIVGRTNRSNTILEYSVDLCVVEISKPSQNVLQYGLSGLILDYVLANSDVVWADLASGNSIALRQGKLFLEEHGLDPSRLRTYGFDVLPVDIEVIQHHITHWPKEYAETLLQQKYSPELHQCDILTVEFPESPDIVTCSESLFWTDDPLKMLQSKLKLGQPYV